MSFIFLAFFLALAKKIKKNSKKGLTRVLLYGILLSRQDIN